MSAAQRLPVLAGTLSFGMVVAAVSLIPSLRNAFHRNMPVGLPPHFWKLVAALFAILNYKSIPFMWHYRVFRGIIYQLKFQPHPLTAPHLFKPIITTSYNPLSDCDYNLHKSNSTYFADLDVSRAHHVGCLIRTGLARLNAGDKTGMPEAALRTPGKFILALGAVACVFRKEIAPLAKFEIWTRCLTWDGKWLYIISHVVKPGAVRPRGYALQPWRKTEGARQRRDGAAAGAGAEEVDVDVKRTVYASSIAKYVLKKGRLTVAPEILLDRSNLLPPRPSGAVSATAELVSGSASGSAGSSGSATPDKLASPESVATDVGAVLGTGPGSQDKGTSGLDADADAGAAGGAMTWEQVEHERLRGLKIAEQFDGLSALHDEFGNDEEVLGLYPDFGW